MKTLVGVMGPQLRISVAPDAGGGGGTEEKSPKELMGDLETS